MKQAISSLRGFISGLWRDRRGATIPIVAVAFVVLAGIAGFVVDASHAFAVQRSLQASTDAAALAGAQDINCCVSAPDQAITTATSYSAVAGARNVMPNLTVTMASGYPVLKCFTSTGVSCSGSSGANGIVVSQHATVPTFFADILGLPSFSITATSTAGIAGGLPKPLDVMIIVDTTSSMNTADTSCSISGATRLTCALAGVRTFLTALAPSVDQVGLMVFPGLSSSSQAAYDYDCSSQAPQTAAYKAASPPMTYQVVPLGSDYRTSNAATTLNPNSDLVKASQGGGSGCAQGLDAVGGYGTFYGDVITAAQAALVANGQASAQKVIMFLSDGDANATAANMTTAKVKNQCHEGITAAQAAAAAGTWVYSIAYGSPTAATPGSCSTDAPAISACSAMQQIASDATKFYSDNQGGTSSCNSTQQSYSELLSLFQGISNSLLPPRLLPNNTT
jgi:Flp pilus assembly protein TadG